MPKDYLFSLYYAIWGFDKASKSLRMKGKNIVLYALESIHKDTIRAPKSSASRNDSWNKANQKPSSELTYKKRNKILTAKQPQVITEFKKARQHFYQEHLHILGTIC